MSLIVSVRSAEGIIIAGDTLLSTSRQIPIDLDVQFNCTGCGETNAVKRQVGSPPVPSNSFPSSRKIFPILDRFGVGTFGMAVIGNETPFLTLKKLEAEKREKNQSFDTVRKCAEALGDRLAKRLRTHRPAGPDDQVAVGLHVNGYDDGKPVTITVLVKNTGATTLSVEGKKGGSYIANGDGALVADLSQRYQKEGGLGALVSAGDAIDFAHFLVRTTIDYQRFRGQIPTVGGQVDIGWITPHAGFAWVKKSNFPILN